MLQKIFKNVVVSDKPYVFEPELVQTDDEAEESLRERRKKLEEEIIQAELHIKQQEEEIIGSAKTQAFNIVEDAQRQGEIIKEQNKREGICSGLRIAAEEYCWKYTQLEQYKEKLDRRCDERIKYIESQIVDIAFDIAEKILSVEIERNDEALAAVIKNGLEKVKDDKELALELSEANAERLDKEEIKTSFLVKTNETFGINDLMLHSEHGTIDMSIRSQFENLKAEMMERLK